MIDKIQVSIVICTHRRFDLLKLAINSLCNQTAPKDQFEVIVVDNDVSSNPEVLKIISEAKTVLNIRYLPEPIVGLSQARNTGGKAASGVYVGYIDDDSRAKENYIEILLKLIAINQYDIIGGPYYPYYLTDRPFWFQDKYESRDSGLTHLFSDNEFLNGTNMVYRKVILEEANWFDTSFGMTGRNISYGEETDLQKRIWKKKGSINVFYSSELVVYHLVPPHKMNLRDRFLRTYNLGKSQAYMWTSDENIGFSRKKAPFVLFKTFTYLIFKIIPQLFLRDKIKYPYWQNYAYEVIARYIMGVGQEWRRTKDFFFKTKSIT